LRRSILEFSPEGHDLIISGGDSVRCLDNECCAFASPDRVAQAHSVERSYDFESCTRYRTFPVFFGKGFFHATIIAKAQRAYGCEKRIFQVAMKKTRNKSRKPPGPQPEVLKIEGDWKDAMRKLISKKRPVSGWPKLEKTKKK
jgi:hypothetical protein